MFQRGAIVVSRSPENWQNDAETEGRMRRAQLIGLTVIVVASGLWATPAVGQIRLDTTTGNFLITQCGFYLKLANSPPDLDLTTEQGIIGFSYMIRCSALIRGAWISSVSTRLVCTPETGTIDQMVRVVYNWLEDHPERLHEDEVILVNDALREAFPCSP